MRSRAWVVAGILASLLLAGNIALAQPLIVNDYLTVDKNAKIIGNVQGPGGVPQAEFVVGGDYGLIPYANFQNQGHHLVVIRQPASTGGSDTPFTGFVFSNNQPGTFNTIAQLMFVNEANTGNEKRIAQILATTHGANGGRMVFRTYQNGIGKEGLILWNSGSAQFNNHVTVTNSITATNGDITATNGKVSTKVVEVRGADMAELFDVVASDEREPEPGMVVCIDPDNPGGLTISRMACDKRVAGVISGAGGLRAGIVLGQEGTLAFGNHPVALNGRVYCFVDASKNAVEPGDLLTTSDAPGHAMKVTDHAKAMGSIIGKAMTPLAKGKTGLVLVLVSIQ